MVRDFWSAVRGRKAAAASETGNWTCPGSLPLISVRGVAIAPGAKAMIAARATRDLSKRMKRSPFRVTIEHTSTTG
jgi:hypothetical protein